MKVLILGLPGSGKSWLAKRLVSHIENCAWFNADKVRESCNDWCFRISGRIRQARRMRTYADFENKNGRMAICDFVAPTEKIRREFSSDYTIWLDTINESRFKNTNKIFEKPKNYDLHIKEFLSDNEIITIAKKLVKIEKSKEIV
ncbi:MAG: adenylyl-sulfate kinase [Rickettsiales bacterium]|nr:adenylyl-sulfate kinase [Rickettsiales bacterium]